MIAKIGKYTIESELGRGGFGRVYRAWDPDMRRQVAIKALTESDPELVRRFALEIDTTAQLQHKNIVIVYERGEEAGIPYVVMELVDGTTLEQTIKEQVPMPLLARVGIMTQVAEGLAYAHSKGVIHRDVKPGNIMVRPDGTVKIMDFGIARVTSRNTINRTRAGFLIGTIPYMAPEQFQTGTTADEQTDVFSFGDVYYEFLTGRHPFALDTDVFTTVTRIREVDPEPVSHLAPGCPEVLELIVHRALARDRSIRYKNMTELLLDCSAVLDDLRHERAAAILDEVRPLIEGGELEAAEQRLVQAAELDPANRQVRELRKRTREEADRRAIAKRITEALEQGRTLMDQRRFGEAVEILKSAARLNNTDTAVQAALQAAQEARGAQMAASRFVSEARREEQHGQLDHALKLLREALALDPRHTDAQVLTPRLEDAVNRREQERQVQQAITVALRLSAEENHEEALATLAPFAADEEKTGVAEVRAQLHARAQQSDVAKTLAKAAALRDAGKLEDASRVLVEGAQRVGDDQPFRQLAKELEAQRYSRGLQALIAEVRERMAAGQYAQGAELISAAEQYRGEPQIVELLASIRSAVAVEQKNRAVAVALITAEQMQKSSGREAALEYVRQQLEKYPGNRILAQVAERLAAEIAGVREVAPPTAAVTPADATETEYPAWNKAQDPPPAPATAAPQQPLPAPLAQRHPKPWPGRRSAVVLTAAASLVAAAALGIGVMSRKPRTSSRQPVAAASPAVALPPPTRVVEQVSKPVIPARSPLTVVPSALTFDLRGDHAGSTSQRVLVRSAEPWSATSNSRWLTARRLSPTQLEVFVRTAGLESGAHEGVVSISSGNQKGLVAVQLMVAAKPAHTAVSVPPAISAASPPPSVAPPATAPALASQPAIDCHSAEYRSKALPEGTIIWTADEPLAPGALVAIGTHQTFVGAQNGTLRGTALPGCPVTIDSPNTDVAFDVTPDGRSVRVMNRGAAPLRTVRLHWKIK